VNAARAPRSSNLFPDFQGTDFQEIATFCMFAPANCQILASASSIRFAMGTKPRYRPQNLARKLLQIRRALGLSQSELLRRLEAEDSFTAARISEYESGVREPSLWMLLAYGRVARVHLETLIDDNASLPDRLPGTFNYRRSSKTLP